MSTMTRPATIRLLAAVASLLLVSALIVRTTDAAFTATTDSTSNSFAAGSVELLDDDADDPMFAVSPTGTFTVDAAGLVPGDVRTQCIVLTYDGDVATGSPVTLATAGGFGGTGLEAYLDVTVDVFSDDACSTPTGATVAGTLSGLAAGSLSGTGWSTGWQPTTNGDVQSFRFSVEVADDNAAQALTVDSVDFTWTASS